MIKNYLKLAWRNIWKSKATFGINVTGLAVAVCAALILSVTAYYQLTFNRFHKDLPSLYQVYHYENEVRGADAKSNLPVSFQDEVKNEFPEVVMSTRYMSTGGLYRFEGKSGSTGIRLVDPDFLNMFSFPILKGDKKPLDNSRQVAFSDKAAKALLGTDDVVGKTIAMKIGEEWDNFTISAIVKAAPDNSDLNFAVLMRFDAHPVYARNKGIWDNFNTEMFVKLVPKATAADFDKHSQSLVNKYYQDQLTRLKRDGAKPDADGYIMKFGVIPVQDMHFNGISASGGGSRKVTTYMLFIIAGFVLFIACINFINLSVARAFSRSKEMGMRKMMGAVRFQLIAQLWGEAVLICLIAGAAGLLLTSILMPEYNARMHTSLTMSLVLKPAMLTGILLVFIIMTVVAGVYPALVMTRINAVQALKGSIKPGRKQYVRNSLIVVQFAFSALLICCTLVAWQQSVYLRSKPLGFNKEQVISLPLSGSDIKRGTLVELLRDNLAGQTGIMSVSAADNNLGIGKDGSSMTSQMTFDYNERQLGTHLMTIDYDYTKTLGIKLVAGRDFDRNLASDSGAIIINQELARQLGGDTILNKFIRFDSDWKPQQVIGITENFNFKSLNKK
ncbi:ABC transporter permease [Chitinophaga sedimenti]|uniref:ABC transporter permease n=1 Tax=Chitinophaga sedimenti TaxID=2033606 RepID=UPI002006C380|nr:ABC transporter permease [Chitinophaga sedimenti]MCK7558876.1 ABC transporter permease [Chitinophaga sedimenti]